MMGNGGDANSFQLPCCPLLDIMEILEEMENGWDDRKK